MLQAQSNKVDSLKQTLGYSQQDTTKGRLYFELAKELAQESISESIDYYLQAKYIGLKYDDTLRVVNCLIGISELYIQLGENDQAVVFAQKALENAKGNCELTARSNTQLSISYFQLQEYERSLECDHQALKCYTDLKDTLYIAYCIHNIGSYYFGINELDSAINHYNRSLKEMSDKDDILYAYNNNRLGFTFTNQQKYEKSIVCHNNAIAFYRDKNMVYELALEENYLASVYFMMKDFKNAFKYAERAIENAEECNDFELHKMNYNLLFDLYRINNDYKNALKYSLLEKAYSDSMDIENKESIIKSIKIRHEFNEQRTVLETSKQSNVDLTNQRTKLIVFSLVSIILLLGCIMVILQKKKKHKRNQELVLELDHVNKSIKDLLSIIGHDLKDSVGNLKHFTQMMHLELLDNKSIEDLVSSFVPMVDSTHGLLDTLLTWSRNNDEHFVSKKEQLSVAHIVKLSYSHLSHLAKSKKIKIVEDIEEATMFVDKNMVQTVLRNLISNAIKFSFAGSSITIKSRVRESHVDFSIIDEGIGMSEKQLGAILNKEKIEHVDGTNGESGSGLGLSLCISFLEKHGANLSAESKKGEGSQFTFSVPMYT